MMEVEPLDQARSRQSDSTLPSLLQSSPFDRVAREGLQFHRAISSESMAAASPVSPTTTKYGPPFSSSYPQPPQNNPNPYATPPESRKNSEDEKRQSLPSLREVGLAPSQSSILNPHTNGTSSYHGHPPLHPPPSAQQSQQPPPPPHQNSHSHPPPPHPSHPPEQRYDYHDSRNSYSQGHPAPIHPNPDQQYAPPRQNSYSHPSPAQYAPRSQSHGSFSGPPPPPGHQYSHGPQPPPVPQHPHPSSQYPPPSQPHYGSSSMLPPYPPPYHHEGNGAHPPTYANGGSPPSKVLGKRPSTGYGGAIERALHVSSMRRDLENSRNRVHSISALVQRLYEQNGSGYQGHGLEVLLGDFTQAIRDAEELREGLEGCRRLLMDICKEQDQHHPSSEKGRIPEYEIEEHGYSDDHHRNVGHQQPELKKVRRGRAAPPGRCHSCHRAETPEWRRGPDGARTLCNACGLHYAKLTRKMSKSNLAATAMTRKPNP